MKTINKYKKILIFFFVILAVGIAVFFYVRRNNMFSTVSTQTKFEESYVSSLDETIKVVRGRSNIVLIDGESRIQFGMALVPDVIFGKNYSLNDIHNVNFLPIYDELSFYSKGYFITLTNLGCNTEERFSDVPEVWVTDCSIRVLSTKSEAPVMQANLFEKEILANTETNLEINSEPLVYISMSNLSLMNWGSGKVGLESGSMTSYSTDTPWNINFVTAYGIDTISYTANEIFNKKSKTVEIGPLKVSTEIKSLNCQSIYEGIVTQECNDILVKFVIVGESGVVKLAHYSGKSK
jgi:hypothetical protein